jgi:hypothetical protein
MPVNLHYMDDRFLYIAGLHAYLLFLLYAAALTNFGGGRLPFRVWILGGFGILAAIALRPDVFVADSIDHLVSLSDSTRWRTLQTSMIGSLVAMGVAWVWRAKFDQIGWIAAWALVGLALGWQAALAIGTITAVSLIIKNRIFGRSDADMPIRYLWLFTALFLIIWRPLANWIDVTLSLLPSIG